MGRRSERCECFRYDHLTTYTLNAISKHAVHAHNTTLCWEVQLANDDGVRTCEPEASTTIRPWSCRSSMHCPARQGLFSR